MAPTRCAENSETPELRHSPFPPWAALCKSTTVRRSWNMSRAMLAVVLSPVAPPQTNAMKPRDQTSQAPPFKRLSRPEGPDPRGQYPALQVARAAVAPQTGGDWGSSRFPRLITISYDAMAGVVGFEPTIHGTKNRCLTTWPHPNVGCHYSGACSGSRVEAKKSSGRIKANSLRIVPGSTVRRWRFLDRHSKVSSARTPQIAAFRAHPL